MKRKQQVEEMSFDQAKKYFLRKGVGVAGVRTQSELNDALNDHRHAFPIHQRFADEIEAYLLAKGYKRGDIKSVHRDVVASRRLRSGRQKASRWLVFRLKFQNWWQKRR